MGIVHPIRSGEDYDAALARVSQLMSMLSPPEGQIDDLEHPARVELDILTDLVEAYEDRHYPVGTPIH